VAIIELGGGFNATELGTYFRQLGLNAPSVLAVGVDGGNNQPGVDTNTDTEVLLDIEVVGAVAPGANIVVYFAPNTDSGFLDAITQAIHDTIHKPSVISISWGGPESSWTGQAMQTFDQAFQDAATLGVTVCCASGDNGSSDGVSDGLAHVDFPASSPYALACGGTSVQASGSTITNEVVWSDNAGATGGGVSDIFPLPTWQTAARVPPSANPNKRVGRGVPDVAGNADPATGYSILVDGQQITVGGTSAVAPLWAGLIALMNQQLGRPVGYLNPTLYSQLANTTSLHDITTGSNGAYQAGAGWDACTGFGSPNGSQLLQALSHTPITTTGNGSLGDALLKLLEAIIALFKALFSRA
jgi:kumamolisin